MVFGIILLIMILMDNYFICVETVYTTTKPILIIPDVLLNDLKNLSVPFSIADNISDEVMMHRIKDAYRRLAFKYHPDRVNQHDPQRATNAEKFISITTSYENLSKYYDNNKDNQK